MPQSIDCPRLRRNRADSEGTHHPGSEKSWLRGRLHRRRDWINDTSTLHAADVGISVDSAVNVAKESTDIILLKQDLNVLIDGVREGRRTFANTMNYIFMATNANFGNIFSMAGASIFLPFLPLLPVQILLTNLLTDLPAIMISSDNVDSAAVENRLTGI